MGRKSARDRPSQESLLQKRRFWGILVIARTRNPGFGRYAARLPGGLFICGLRNSVVGGVRGADSAPQRESVPGFRRLVEPKSLRKFNAPVCKMRAHGWSGER